MSQIFQIDGFALLKAGFSACVRGCLHLLPSWQNLFLLYCIFLIEALNFSLFSSGFCSFVSIYSVRQDLLEGFFLSVTISTESSVHLLNQFCACKSRPLCILLSLLKRLTEQALNLGNNRQSWEITVNYLSK